MSNKQTIPDAEKYAHGIASGYRVWLITAATSLRFESARVPRADDPFPGLTSTAITFGVPNTAKLAPLTHREFGFTEDLCDFGFCCVQSETQIPRPPGNSARQRLHSGLASIAFGFSHLRPAAAPLEADGNLAPEENRAEEPPFTSQARRRGRQATSAQHRVIDRLAERTGVDLSRLLLEDFGVSRLDQLSVSDAAQLILYLQKSVTQSAATS